MLQTAAGAKSVFRTRAYEKTMASASQSPWIQPAYDGLKHLPFADHPLFVSVVALASFHVFCALHSLDDVIRLRRSGVGQTLLYCALPQLVMHIVANTLVWHLFAFERTPLPDAAPSVAAFLADLLACYVVGDFLIYWEHYYMHKIQFLRFNIHAVHHAYTSPLFSWHAGWVHPVEIASAIACEMAWPLLTGTHPFTLVVFVSTWVFWLVEEHAGKDVWWSLDNVLPWDLGGGSRPHDLHHAPLLTKNFSFVFSAWDHLFGTFAPPQPRGGVGGVAVKKAF